jgi:O-antigen ligase
VYATRSIVSLDVERFAKWLIGSKARLKLAMATGILCVSPFVLWNLYSSNWPILRRAMSVMNLYDFSWRNRVEAYRGGLAMIGDSPLIGFGWNQTYHLYDQYYRSAKVVEAGAIELNDYITLSYILGLPALWCFIVYIRKSMSADPRSKNSSTTPAQTICRACALAIVVSFFFDGGLFRCPTAGVFWILLELGKRGFAGPPISNGSKSGEVVI